MNCKDFKELADSYLSDELAVETNHQVFNHLETCAECRAQFAIRRDLREKLRVSMKTAPEFQIDLAFANKLSASLRKETAQKKNRLNWKIFTPVLATLLIIITLGFVTLYQRNQGDVSFWDSIDGALQTYLIEMSHKAIGDHKYCALDKLSWWEASAGKLTTEQTAFVKTLQDGKTEVLAAHDCEFGGKTFTHYILRRGGRIISVSKIKSEHTALPHPRLKNRIISETESGFQVASFQDGTNLVFVVSNLTETENLAMARALSDSLKPQI